MTIAEHMIKTLQHKEVLRANDLPENLYSPQETDDLVTEGDYVWVKRHRRKRWSEPRWEGPYQVLLKTPSAIKVVEKPSWIHLSHCKKQQTLTDPVGSTVVQQH